MWRRKERRRKQAHVREREGRRRKLELELELDRGWELGWDWTGDWDGNGNWNCNILSSNWEGDNGYSLIGGTDPLFNGLCNDLFHRISHLNPFRDEKLFRLAATLGIVVFSRHFGWTDLCSHKWRRRLALANRHGDVVRHGPIFRDCLPKTLFVASDSVEHDLGGSINGRDARQ